MKQVAFNIRMDEGRHKDLKVFCVSHGVSMQEFIQKAVDEYRKKWVV